MVLDAAQSPLRLAELPDPEPARGQVLLRVLACGVCRTDLHIVDGELTSPSSHSSSGIRSSARYSREARGTSRAARVGVPWLGWTCGACRYCLAGDENLCDRARFTGYDIDGGYAELAVADERYCFPIPKGYADEQAAPLLCAGLIGYRSLRLAGDAERIGLYGFGASAHIVCQVAVAQGRQRLRGNPRGRRGDAAVRQVAGRRLGRRRARRATRRARLRDRLRPGGRARSGCAPTRPKRRRPWSAPEST